MTETSADSTGPEAIDEVATETTGGTLAPVFQTLARWKETVCAIDTQGAGWCWGSNDGYILGVGPGGPVNSPEPVAIAGNHKWMALALGREHGCGLDDGGQAWCWGHNQDGVFGDGTTVDSNLPVPCATGLVLADIDAERRSTCGVTRAGELYCWGSGYQSAAYCWGPNSNGQIGDGAEGTDAKRMVPTAVVGGYSWSTIVPGSCGVTTGNAAYCWGSNESGELGTGSTGENSLTPAAVAGEHSFAAP